jgi:hypothetical protein
MAAAAPLLLLPRERERDALVVGLERERGGGCQMQKLMVWWCQRAGAGERGAVLRGRFPKWHGNKRYKTMRDFRAKRGGKDGLYCKVAQLD